jgi:hypothetical protein
LHFLALGYASGASAQVDPPLVEKLRQGGYVLYMRHTSTDFSRNDANSRSFEDCANQRNLTDKGRAEARAVGEHAVVRPERDGRFRVVARIRLEDW